jgi:1-acyl-sn-glycerol-3-phosphate acyltransferase
MKMVDEQHLRRVKISARPRGQRAMAHALHLTYALPSKTHITIEGLENLSTDRGVMIALNHTDRYNYWPLQYELWRIGYERMTMAWVKAKYYENKVLGRFFDLCNNLPLPSLGYVILKDAFSVLKRKMSDNEYRVVRDLADCKINQDEALGMATADVRHLLTHPRGDFNPSHEGYFEFINRWSDRLMGAVEDRTLEALREKKNHIIVFPQGTRSIRLLPARTGMIQFALRHNIPIVPVGSNGCEQIYPTGNPWAKGGKVTYRIGKPLTVDNAFAPFRIDEPFKPFTKEAHPHHEKLEGAANSLTQAIDDLLDEPYKMDRDGADAGSRADRLM